MRRVAVHPRGGILGVLCRHIAQLSVIAYDRNAHCDFSSRNAAEIIGKDTEILLIALKADEQTPRCVSAFSVMLAQKRYICL